MSWNMNPSLRLRAYFRRMKNTLPRSRAGGEIHLKRAKAEIAVIEGIALTREVIPARVLLNDLSLRGIFLFSSAQLAVGQRVTLSIQGPRTFYIRGRVVTCKLLSNHSTVRSEQSYPYRVGVLFEFRSVDERVQVKKYVDEIAENYLTSAANC